MSKLVNLCKAALLGILIAQTATGAAIQGQNATSNLYGKSFLQVPVNQATDLGANKALIETGNKNLLINASFEHKVFDTNWTLLGSATDAVETSTIIDGVKAAKINITTSGDGIAASVTPAVNTLNQQMEASCKVNTSMTNIQLCATAGGVEQSCQPVPATGSYQAVSANFQGPVNGTAVGVKIKSTSAGTGAVYADDCFVGPARNLSQVSQAQDLGTVTIACTGNFSTTTSSTTTPAPFPVQTGCTYSFSPGSQIAAPATMVPGFVIPSGGPGTYTFNAEGEFYAQMNPNASNNNNEALFNFGDGTSSSGVSNVGLYYSQTNFGMTTIAPNLYGQLTYTSAFTNKTIQVQASIFGNTSAAGIANAPPLVLHVKYFPSAGTGSTALTSANNVANWAGSTSGAIAGSTSSTTFGVLGSLTGSLTPNATNRNITCAAASGTMGITCTLPRAGNYQACYAGYGSNGTSGSGLGSELVDGSGNIIVGSQFFYSVSAGQYGTYGGCGTFTVASAGSFTVQVYGRVIGGGTATLDTTSMSISALDGMGGPVILSAPSSSGNFMTGGDGESGANICTPYADAAGVAPVTGSGGAPTVSCALSSVSPISGTQSYVLTKPASNVQGQGWSFPFTVDSAGQAKMLQVSFDYQVDSNYTVGSDTSTPDIVAYVYGPTDGTPQLTQLTPYKVLGGSGTLKFQGNLQTAASGKAYRLILHEPNTGALASTIKVDNIVVSPVLRQFGTPVTDFQAYTPTIVGAGTVSSVLFQSRRVGDSLEVQGTFVTGAPTATIASLSLPAGLTIDATKLSGASLAQVVGSQIRHVASTSNNYVPIFVPTSSLTNIYFSATSVGTIAPQTPQPGNNIWGTSETQTVRFTVPIVGWSSSTQMSDQSGDNRMVVWNGYTTSTQSASTSGTQITSWVTTNDSHAAFNTGTSSYVIPSAGYYTIAGSFYYGAAGANNQSRAWISVNGSTTLSGPSVNQTTSQPGTVPFFGTYKFNAGDTLTFFAYCQNSTALVAGSAYGQSSWSIIKYPGNQQIAASESANAAYYSAAGQSIPTGSNTTINFDQKTTDSHGAVTTGASWKFVAPSPGTYYAGAIIGWLNVAAGTRRTFIRVNGTSKLFAESQPNAATVLSQTPAGLLKLNQGDVVDVQVFQNSGGAALLNASADSVTFGIYRIGN